MYTHTNHNISISIPIDISPQTPPPKTSEPTTEANPNPNLYILPTTLHPSPNNIYKRRPSTTHPPAIPRGKPLTWAIYTDLRTPMLSTAELLATVRLAIAEGTAWVAPTKMELETRTNTGRRRLTFGIEVKGWFVFKEEAYEAAEERLRYLEGLVQRGEMEVGEPFVDPEGLWEGVNREIHEDWEVRN